MSLEIETAAVQANRQLFSLLKDKIACLSKKEADVAMAWAVDDNKAPFFYSAQGSDGHAGIAMSLTSFGPTNPSFGYVRMQSDAAFVATRMYAMVSRKIADQTLFFGQPSLAIASIGFRIYDESSSRWITVGNREQNATQDVTTSLRVVGPSDYFSAGGLELPADCTFPRSATLRVEAYSMASLEGLQEFRVYFIFGGYKVYGG